MIFHSIEYTRLYGVGIDRHRLLAVRYDTCDVGAHLYPYTLHILTSAFNDERRRRVRKKKGFAGAKEKENNEKIVYATSLATTE